MAQVLDFPPLWGLVDAHALWHGATPVTSLSVMSDGPISHGPISHGPISNGSISDGAISDGLISDSPISDGPISDGPIGDGPIGDGPIDGERRRRGRARVWFTRKRTAHRCTRAGPPPGGPGPFTAFAPSKHPPSRTAHG